MVGKVVAEGTVEDILEIPIPSPVHISRVD